MCDNSASLAEYVKDKRPECKYGYDCYQKNPQHHEKYKHPPKKRKLQTGDTNVKKKIKINDYFKGLTKKNDNGESSCSELDTSKVDFRRDVTENRVNDEILPSKKTKNLEETGDTQIQMQVDKEKRIFNTETEHKENEISRTDESDATYTQNKAETSRFHADDDDTEGKSYQVSDSRVNVRKKLEFNKPVMNEGERREFIKNKFLFDMPIDFYEFWDFCKSFNKENPSSALDSIGLRLVGPYDVLAGKFDNNSLPDEQYLLHWRYYHDPPELQTIIKGDNATGFHIGYFRDTPDNMPSLLVCNSAEKDGVLQCVGDNIFAAVNTYLEELKQTGDPFKKMQINKYQLAIKKRVDELGLDISKKSKKIVQRDIKAVARTFNKVGLVVPYNKKTQMGYRSLTVGNKELRILLDKIEKATGDERQKYLSELQPVLTYASIATDESDFGTGIELGWDLICHGVSCLNSTITRFLATNYKLLKRDVFAKIIEVHMNNRKRRCNLGVV